VAGGATKAPGRRRRIPDHEDGMRWMLTYSDMITLLLALFMVLFSISSLNISKYKSLQHSIKSSFSGSILSGGRSILQTGSDQTTQNSISNIQLPTIAPITPAIARPSSSATVSQAEMKTLVSDAQLASQEQYELTTLERRINAYAKAHGWSNEVRAQLQQRGLVVTVLTDKLLFASGSDELRSAGQPLLNEIATLVNLDTEAHPVVVEGYTDNMPIDTSQFPSNWVLSTGRATSVLQYLLTRNVPGKRLSAAGYGDNFPVASNATTTGRARNRRVEIVFERKYQL
jgi:chemotaxis protein MotB